MRLQATVRCEMKKKPPHSPFSHQDPGYWLMLPHPQAKFWLLDSHSALSSSEPLSSSILVAS